MRFSDFETFNLSVDEFNRLHFTKKFELMNPFLINPFKILEGTPMCNAISLELYGNWEDGDHLIFNPINLNFTDKIRVVNNEVVERIKFTL
jgi:hypothetical protein